MNGSVHIPGKKGQASLCSKPEKISGSARRSSRITRNRPRVRHDRAVIVPDDRDTILAGEGELMLLRKPNRPGGVQGRFLQAETNLGRGQKGGYNTGLKRTSFVPTSSYQSSLLSAGILNGLFHSSYFLSGGLLG